MFSFCFHYASFKTTHWIHTLTSGVKSTLTTMKVNHILAVDAPLWMNMQALIHFTLSLWPSWEHKQVRAEEATEVIEIVDIRRYSTRTSSTRTLSIQCPAPKSASAFTSNRDVKPTKCPLCSLEGKIIMLFITRWHNSFSLPGKRIMLQPLCHTWY